ncbi:MAG: type 1 glutamine amidotransferase [Micromonosporaceae bacterium]
MTPDERPLLVLTHSELDSPGAIADWAAARGYTLDVVRADAAAALPDPRCYAALIVLGSVESVRDDAVGWVRPERDVVRTAVDHDVPVLGVCFGGQLLAQTLGGEILACEPPEVGWQAIESDEPWTVPAGPWLVWHDERFTVPPGAREIARSQACPQAFVQGPHMGVQFHPEITTALLNSWVSDAVGRGTLRPGDRSALLADVEETGAAPSRDIATHLLSAFIRRAGLPAAQR